MEHLFNLPDRFEMSSKHAHNHRQIKHRKSQWSEKSPLTVPYESQEALREAMRLDGVSAAEYNDLLWIMAQESGGVVNAHNSASSARGLFQLLQAQYDLNPHGANSFGNPVEECQGGIHYIMGRYHSASNAKAFWQTHHWY